MHKIVINFPPDFDGCLNIEVTAISQMNPTKPAYRYNFIHANAGNEWETLVKAAEGILAQNQRRLNHKKLNEKQA